MAAIDTARFSAALRARAIDLARRRLLVTQFGGSLQENDLSEPANCGGFGRIRHFKRTTSPGWPPNPLPIDPAGAALGLPSGDELRAQVFQNAACNWRCWYCFVDFALLAADPKRAAWLSAADLLDLYSGEPNRPPVIDLTGGQPDLVPEWVPWMMHELSARGLDRTVYLWSDDNLSNDYFWRYLSEADRELVAGYRMYGKVGCFKGFDSHSFAFNTGAAADLYDRQFELMGRLLELGLDQYAYATFTTPHADGIADAMVRFVDRLQELDPNLPLRTVPLEISTDFVPVRRRAVTFGAAATGHQWLAVEAWHRELERRYASSERDLPINRVALRRRAIAT